MASPVKRETMRACLSCRLCDSILRDATTISECLHTFCRKCIYEKIREDEIECCPVCNIDLGGAPLEKLRPDHNLQDLRAKIFPLKQRKANAPEIVSLSARRKERSISSLIVSTPRVSAQAGTTGKRAKTATRKVLGGNGSLAERTVEKEESSFREELMGHEPEDILAFSKECSFKALPVPDHLAQENRVLRHMPDLAGVRETEVPPGQEVVASGDQVEDVVVERVPVEPEVVEVSDEGRESEAEDEPEVPGGDGAGVSGGGAEEAVDHSFDFSYEHGVAPFVSDKAACAELVFAAALGRRPFLCPVSEMAESDAFQSTARSLVRTMVNLATLGERYERQVLEQERVNEHLKMRNQVGEEALTAVIRETRQALKDEKARSVALEASLEQVRARAMETDQALAELEAEKARSDALEEELALARGEVAKACGERKASRSRVAWLEGAIERAKVAVAKESDRVKKKWAARNQKWATKMEKIRGHLAGRDQALLTHLLLSQVVGTRKCLERMEAEDNLVVPFYRYAKLKEDAVKYEAELDQIDFPELTSEDLEVPADRIPEVQLQQPPSSQTWAASSPPRAASDPSAIDLALGATVPLGQADIAALGCFAPPA